MRIVESMDTTLRLRDRTLWVAIACFAAAVLGLRDYVLHSIDVTKIVPSVLFVIFGLAFLRSTDVTFDKVARICTLRPLDVVRVAHRAFALDEIKEIQVDTEFVSGDMRCMPCRFRLVTVSEIIPLSLGYEPDLKRYETMRKEILDSVFAKGDKPAAPDPLTALVMEGRVVDAISILREREGVDLATASGRVDEMRVKMER